MKLFVAAALAAAVALAGAVTADAVVIQTKWNERVEFKHKNGTGFLRLYVRSIEVTPTRWKAAVGVTNGSGIEVRFTSGLDQPDPNLPFTYWASPGIWWSQYVKGGTWQPGAGSSLTHSVRAAGVRPEFPTRLGARKSWFGTFSGSLAKVPTDRLLRIGFGLFLDPATYECVDLGTGCVHRRVPLSTTHQFRLPKRR
jgi:hypothetical protein